MTESILNSVKKVLGLADDYDAFDADITMHINSAFSTLHQLGIGPTQGFQIDGDAKLWSEFLEGDLRLNNVKSYICLRVRMIFDPPGNSFAVDAIQKQITELEWRINAQREDEEWTEPIPS